MLSCLPIFALVNPILFSLLDKASQTPVDLHFSEIRLMRFDSLIPLLEFRRKPHLSVARQFSVQEYSVRQVVRFEVEMQNLISSFLYRQQLEIPLVRVALLKLARLFRHQFGCRFYQQLFSVFLLEHLDRIGSPYLIAYQYARRIANEFFGRRAL